jgi:hypothetical protein
MMQWHFFYKVSVVSESTTSTSNLGSHNTLTNQVVSIVLGQNGQSTHQIYSICQLGNVLEKEKK